MLGLAKKTAIGEVLNVATGTPTAINQLLETLQQIMKTNLKPIYEKSRSGDIKHSYADMTRIRRLLQFDPKISLKNGLAELVRWYVDLSQA